MSDDNSSWSRGLKRWLAAAPETQDELLKILQDCRKFLDDDTVDMLEGVLDLPATQVKEIMTPRTQMVGISSEENLMDILAAVQKTAHSRYPVFDSNDNESVLGILLTKDLIPFLLNKDLPLSLEKLVRKPLYISEAARCDTLLRSLQRSQVHMAIVLDEFGGVAGVVTMEDLLEEIVGDIVDEHDNIDKDSDINNIVPHPTRAGVWVVQAATPIGDCNELLGSHFDDTDVDTMGGLVMQAMGAVSRLQGEMVTIDGWQITVVQAEGPVIGELNLMPIPDLHAGD